MRRHRAALIALGLVAVIVTVSGASYVSELLFVGEGWYDHDASPKGPTGYGAFGESIIDFDVTLRTPDGACNWYFRPDFSITFESAAPGLGLSHVIAADEVGIWADGQVVEWSTLGYSWDSTYGVHLGYHDPAADGDDDPLNIVGDYAWDIDGGGDDLTASIRPSTTTDYTYRLTTQQMRSMAWLPTLPLGSMAGQWLSAFTGGMPLDGLASGIDQVAPCFAMWDGMSYEISYGGSVVLTADAACPVPEPSSVLLLGAGLAALGGMGLRRRRTR